MALGNRPWLARKGCALENPSAAKTGWSAGLRDERVAKVGQELDAELEAALLAASGA